MGKEWSVEICNSILPNSPLILITIISPMNRYNTDIEVRYAETDAMGVVHHSSYAVWFELARVQALRVLGLAYDRLEAEGFSLPVLKLEIEYLRPAKFGDFVRVQVDLEREGGILFHFVYEVFRGEELLARGKTSHAFTSQGKPVRPPKIFLDIAFAE